MIRVKKCGQVPVSLTSTKSYDNEDVKKQLIADQYSKCYLCERTLTTDFEIEHLLSANNYPELKQDWKNLHLSCSYCNGKKLDNYDNTLNPSQTNIEEEIMQVIDPLKKRAIFSTTTNDLQHNTTVDLLNHLYNGSRNTGLRKIKEEKFFNCVADGINYFHSIVNNYLNNPNKETEEIVRDELAIDREFLGFKYWIIKSNQKLQTVFGHSMVWNKY